VANINFGDVDSHGGEIISSKINPVVSMLSHSFIAAPLLVRRKNQKASRREKSFSHGGFVFNPSGNSSS
jgi:hypothetical protein